MSIVRGIKRLLFLQLLVCACISIIMAISLGYVAAKSAFLAGAVCILPNVLFARKLFYYQGARSAKQIVNSFYAGEAVKLLSAMALFSLVFMFAEIKPLVFFLTFIVVQMSIWFAPLLSDNQQDGLKRD